MRLKWVGRRGWLKEVGLFVGSDERVGSGRCLLSIAQRILKEL